MSVLSGTMAYQPFRITHELRLSPEQIIEKLRLFKFKPLHPQGLDNDTHGWVLYQSEYDHEQVISTADCYFDQKIILALRMDSLLVPKQLLRALVKKSLAAYQRDQKKPPDRVVKKEIELAEAHSLRSRILPKTRIIEAVWCLSSQELRIFSRSSSQVEKFLELFQDTFLLKPERHDFIESSYYYAQKHADLASLELLSHQPLFLPSSRVDIQ